MDQLAVSQAKIDQVHGHLRAGLVGPLDECQAVVDQCQVNCSGCIDLHCDDCEKVVTKCSDKVDQFLVDKLGYVYGVMSRFGYAVPSLQELQERSGQPIWIPESPPAQQLGQAGVGWPGGELGNLTDPAGGPPLVVEAEPVFQGNPAVLPGQMVPPANFIPIQDPIGAAAAGIAGIDFKPEPANPVKAEGPPMDKGRQRGPLDNNPVQNEQAQVMPPWMCAGVFPPPLQMLPMIMQVLNLLVCCEKIPPSRAVPAVDDWVRGRKPLQLPEEPRVEWAPPEWIPPAFPQEGAPY